MRSWRLVLGAVLVASQAVWVVFALFHPWRWFAWAPNDYVTRYHVEVEAEGRRLSVDEICDRFKGDFCSPSEGTGYVDEGPPEHLISQLRQYEELYGKPGDRIVLRYTSTSFKGTRVWTWPST